jgi:hypothetical protein
MAENKAENSGKVLKSYRKVGSRFVPPMLQMFQFEDVSWLRQTMPELIWWDVLIQKASLRFAAHLVEAIATYFKQMNNHAHQWSFLSDYSDMPEEIAQGLAGSLTKAGMLNEIQACLSDFLDLYPACPIARVLDLQPTGIMDVGYLTEFEERLRVLENKRSRDAVLVQAQAVYMGFASERLHVKEGLALAAFPEVVNYPDTERSVEIGASICATVNMLAGRDLPKFREDGWVQYFWQRSLELHPLNLRHLERE